MNVFLFQSVQGRYDLSAELRPYTKEPWFATRYRTDMQPGDLVYFWMGGDASIRGLYGWGRLTSEPYPEGDTYRVDVYYEVRFAAAISANSIREDEELTDLLIFRAPQATNFLLSARHAMRLGQVVSSHGEVPPVLAALAE